MQNARGTKMSRYIDAESLENAYKYVYCNTCTRTPQPVICSSCWVDDALNVIDDSPIEDVAPVVHAQWNEFSDYTGTCYAECSHCGLLWWIEEGTAKENEMFYCPKCGAKMDGKEGKE